MVSQAGWFNGHADAIKHDCHLEKGEYITGIKTYETTQWHILIQGGLTLITNKKTCGPCGKVTADEYYFGQGRLLYMFGRNGYLFDRVDFVFDVC